MTTTPSARAREAAAAPDRVDLIHAMSPEGQHEQLWADRGAGTWHPADEA